ncbi:hypothetical protein SLS55_001812 [Diplodia seriata]|uniref:BZIP domain-containing protein n=1 Tax=Diplodia seriata TaxID=420778 RepID=A0ABR3CQC9_9PEZI
MTGSDFDFETRPQTRVDSLAGYSAVSFPSMSGGVEETATGKFSFSPQQDSMDFDPTNAATFSQDLEQVTVHPGVLSGNNNPLFDGHGQSSENFFNPQMFTTLPSVRSQHGQITPPDDLSPKSAESKLAFNSSKDSEIQVKVEDSTEVATASNKRKRSSKGSVGSSTRKRGRKSVVVVEDDSQDPEDKAKRDQFLERNRVAAHKCRQKKKEWMVQLDNDCRDLAARNKYLSAEVNVLSNTMYELKNLIFQHADCGYQPINEFIGKEAEKVHVGVRAQAASDPAGAMQASSYQSPGPYPPSNMSVSGQGGPSMFPGRGSVDFGRSAERASTEASDLGSIRSNSTASDGMLNESWADMLQQSQ